MKKTLKVLTLVLAAVLMTSFAVPAHANTIPREAIPDGTPQQAVDVAERLVADTLIKVQNGMGYADAKGETNRIIFKAFINNQTDGYSYGLLKVIANNAIFEYRDIYLRPEYYAQAEEKVKVIIAELITAVENGQMSYYDAKKEAYNLIYKSVDPTFDPKDRFLVDFCYWDVISVDGAMFNRARKLLIEAEDRWIAKSTTGQCPATT